MAGSLQLQPSGAVTPEVLARFMKKVRIEDGHWIWTGCSDGNYGKLWVNGRLLAANRIAMELYMRVDIPKGKLVVRACSKKLCVSPLHHFIGTRSESGLMATLHERHGIFDIIVAADIREQLEQGKTQRDLAAEYEVGQTAIGCVGMKKTYFAAENLEKRLRRMRRFAVVLDG